MHDHILSTAGDALTPFFFGHTLGFAKSKHGQKKTRAEFKKYIIRIII